jgi:LPS export ABC transporter protein LptC
MNWRKRLRLGIAVFVVVFAAIVGLSLKKGRVRATPPPVPQIDHGPVIQSKGPTDFELRKEGKVTFQIKSGNQRSYADGRSIFGGGVTVVLPDRGGRRVTVESQEAEVTQPPGKEIGIAVFTGGVKLVTSDGVTITSATATYNNDEQIARIPGPLTFTKGRMTGTGVGATFDQARNVLWLLDQAKVDVAADKKGGGAIHVTSKAAGMARLEHYMKFTGGAHLDGEGRIIDADEATAFLTEDDERMTRMELRGNARITGKPGGSGPQDMRARDIDLAYAENGRTLQSAHMIDNAAVQLPGEKGSPGRRIAGKAIDVALAPDGATVTSLTANENVQVDLPPDGDNPSRRIRAASLMATGAPPAPGGGAGGIQAATFLGDVEYRESRAARAKLAAIDRTAKSKRLDIKTKPGFGDLEQADFHSNVHFTDGTRTTADAPMAVYSIGKDRLDLSPGSGDTGPEPHVSDGRISVNARGIQMTLGTQAMKADTRVRSVMIPQSGKTAATPAVPAPKGTAGTAAGSAPAPSGQPPAKSDSGEVVKLPSMLKQDQPVTVSSNRLDYDGAKSVATYEGNARLWQDDTVIQADKIVLEDNTGNLHATTKVVTVMTLTTPDDKESKDPKKDAKKPDVEPTHTTADELLYEDGKHRATYTGNTHMSGPSGDLTADRLELYLAEQGGQLERAEADGNVVSRQEARRAYGKHLTYIAKDDIYTMTGSPVKLYDDAAPTCKVSEGAIARFHRTGNTMDVSGSDTIPHKSANIPCGSSGSH